jgi:class I fructose-bisphosphate aldolase
MNSAKTIVITGSQSGMGLSTRNLLERHGIRVIGVTNTGEAEILTDLSKKDGVDYHTSADLSAQANHLGVTIQADIIKQKLPTNNGGYNAINFGKTHKSVYEKLTTDHPIDLTRYQVANCYMGRAGLINSGGDMAEAVETAIINKRAGGMGLISGRKAFQKDMKVGVELLNAIQDVYLNKDIDIA